MASIPSSTAELEAFVERYLAAWNDHDAPAMADLLTQDIVWEDPALAQPARGIAAVQAFMRATWVGLPDCASTSRSSRTAPPRARRSLGVGACAAR